MRVENKVKYAGAMLLASVLGSLTLLDVRGTRLRSIPEAEGMVNEPHVSLSVLSHTASPGRLGNPIECEESRGITDVTNCLPRLRTLWYALQLA